MTSKIKYRLAPILAQYRLAPILALAIASPGIAVAQGDSGPPFRADLEAVQRRETDDIALLLGLRPDQRPALATYLQSLAPPAPPEDPRARHRPAAGAIPPDDGFARHLQRMADATARISADQSRRIVVARTFYDGLDPNQRRAFEALMRVRHGPPILPGGPRPGGFMPGGPLDEGRHDGPPDEGVPG